MSKGISVYMGLGYSLEDNLKYIKKAREMGYKNIFTSLHIPEADYERAIYEFKSMVSMASELNMNVVADISPRTFSYLNCDMNNLEVLKNLGIYGIRVDFGFTPQEIANFTKNPYGLKIEINASTVTKGFLQEFEKCSPDFSKLQACHNYYPRLNTGISIKSFKNKNEMLKKYNIEIAAFIPSQVNKRGPIYEGLPTLEIHRFSEPVVSAKHLFALGVDSVLFGDSIPSDEELYEVAQIPEDSIEFRVRLLNPSKIENDILFKDVHINRPDSAEDVVRSTDSRNYLKGRGVISHDNLPRTLGSVTIDNDKYLRYCGELQICLGELPADDRVNVIGEIIEEEKFLLEYIDDETRFKFKGVQI